MRLLTAATIMAALLSFAGCAQEKLETQGYQALEERKKPAPAPEKKPKVDPQQPVVQIPDRDPLIAPQPRGDGQIAARPALDPSNILSAGNAATIGVTAGKINEPREIKLLIPEKTFSSVRGTLRITYDDFDLLKILNMEPVPPDAEKHFPTWLRELDGQKVRLRGFMYPPPIASGIQSFVLARDNQICCFGKNPKVYDLVRVLMQDGRTTHYIKNRPFDVVGTFRVRPWARKGKLLELYEIEDAIVIPK